MTSSTRATFALATLVAIGCTDPLDAADETTGDDRAEVAAPRPPLIFQKACINSNPNAPAEHASESGWAFIKFTPAGGVQFFAAATRSSNPTAFVTTDLANADLFWAGSSAAPPCGAGAAPYVGSCELEERVGLISNPAAADTVLVRWQPRLLANDAMICPITFGAGTLGLPTDDTFVCSFTPVRGVDCFEVLTKFKQLRARGVDPGFEFPSLLEACPLF